MDILSIENKLSNDFPQHEFNINDVTPDKDSSEFSKLNINIDGKDYKITTRKNVGVVVSELQKYHAINEEMIEEAVYDAIKFEVELFLGGGR